MSPPADLLDVGLRAEQAVHRLACLLDAELVQLRSPRRRESGHDLLHVFVERHANLLMRCRSSGPRRAHVHLARAEGALASRG
jgi:hypothetical protein